MKLKIQSIIVLVILIIIAVILLKLTRPLFPPRKIENTQLNLEELQSLLNNTKTTYMNSNKGTGDILFQKDIVISSATNEITQEVQVNKNYESLVVYLGMSYETGDINLKITDPQKVVLSDQLNKDIFSHQPSMWNLGTINNPTKGLWKITLYNIQPNQQNAKAYLVVTGL